MEIFKFIAHVSEVSIYGNFSKDIFQAYNFNLREKIKQNRSDTGRAIADLFQVLDTPHACHLNTPRIFSATMRTVSIGKRPWG